MGARRVSGIGISINSTLSLVAEERVSFAVRLSRADRSSRKDPCARIQSTPPRLTARICQVALLTISSVISGGNHP